MGETPYPETWVLRGFVFRRADSRVPGRKKWCARNVQPQVKYLTLYFHSFSQRWEAQLKIIWLGVVLYSTGVSESSGESALDIALEKAEMFGTRLRVVK